MNKKDREYNNSIKQYMDAGLTKNEAIEQIDRQGNINMSWSASEGSRRIEKNRQEFARDIG